MAEVNLLTVLVSVVSSSAVGGLISLLVKRRNDRKDAHEDRRIAAYDAVNEALAMVRSTGLQAESDFDWNSPPGPLFDSTYAAMSKARDVIETKRLATGPVFADAAIEVLEWWKFGLALMQAQDYEGETLKPDLAARERAVYESIPMELRERIAPGTLRDLETAEKVALEKKKVEESLARLGVTARVLTDKAELEQLGISTAVQRRD